MQKSFDAKFSTGATAQLYDVTVAVRGNSLLITDNATDNWSRWKLKDVQLVDDDHGKNRNDLTLREDGKQGGRLFFESRDFQPVLAELRPDLFASSYNIHEWKDAAKLCMIGMVILVMAGLYGVSALATGVAAIIPLDRERQMGQQVEDELFSAGTFSPLGYKPQVCLDPAGRKVLQDLTDKLTAHVDSKHEFRVRVIDHNVENAFAIPGGNIYILRGLLDNAKSPDEVAGVLAHEIAHVTQRHSVKRIVKSLGLEAVITTVSGGGLANAGKLTEFITKSGYSRADESEADRVGIKLLQKAGMSQEGLVSFFDRLAANSGGETGIFDSHPGSAERKQAAEKLLKPGQPAMDVAEYAALKRICRSTGSRAASLQPIPDNVVIPTHHNSKTKIGNKGGKK